MKSNKQRRAELKVKRLQRAEKRVAVSRNRKLTMSPRDCVAVNLDALTPHGSYGWPDFVVRGFYTPIAFSCKDCGVNEIWTAKQQKLWYEDWHGYQFSTAVRCRACRAKERARKVAARAPQMSRSSVEAVNEKQ